ncbi:MAG: FtsX-like permease family protein [Gemmatimonadales bacterium]
MGVRAALGAGRLRLARQLVTESVTLGLVAGILGAALAALGVKLLAARFPGDLPRAAEVTVDGRVLAFALAVSLLTAVAFGLAPALALREGRTVEAIKSGGAADRGGRSRFRSGLVVAEIALALVLLVGAGLLFRSFVRMIRVDPGFDPGGLVVAKLELRRPFTSDSATRARDAEWRVGFSRAVTERIRGLPGVVSASAGVVAPMVRTGTGRCCWGADVVRTEDSTEVRGRIMIHPIGPGYFATIGARLRGREFAAERQASPYPAILSDALAARLFGGADPVGRKLAIDDGGFIVSGVVSGLHQWGLDQSGDLEVFVPYDPLGIDFNMLDLTVRGSVPAAALVPAIRQAIWDLEPTLPADDVVPMEQLIRRSLAAPRFIGTLMGIFGGLALLLAAAGVYASMLYAVRQRNREMGIRVAMGADAPAITRMVVGDAGRLALLGLVIGTAGGAGLARLLTSFLFEVEPGDPIAFAAGAALLGGAVLLAAWLPARRAGRADPLAVLRSD